MFSTLRRHFGVPGMIAVIALVFAMMGGAYAAKKSGFVITKLSQIKPSVRNQLKGNAGPKGATGPQGPKGDVGAMGPQGPQGAKGAAGSPWTIGGVVPSGQTLVGSWSAENEWATAENDVQQFFRVPISFTIPLSAAPAVRMFSESIFFTVTSAGVFEPYFEPDAEEKFEAVCPGSADSPSAEPGNLCLYLDQATKAGTGYSLLKLATATPPPHTYGWSLPLTLEAESLVEGSWAVTAK
jgi:hypothetical protein